ncbi:hypothetical protein C8R44DRAFT_304062 [Mycena epipterygia]|nr:hypothetical protein C8R44DRAFT_304062 [Mycena epipterygia]
MMNVPRGPRPLLTLMAQPKTPMSASPSDIHPNAYGYLHSLGLLLRCIILVVLLLAGSLFNLAVDSTNMSLVTILATAYGTFILTLFAAHATAFHNLLPVQAEPIALTLVSFTGLGKSPPPLYIVS